MIKLEVVLTAQLGVLWHSSFNCIARFHNLYTSLITDSEERLEDQRATIGDLLETRRDDCAQRNMSTSIEPIILPVIAAVVAPLALVPLYFRPLRNVSPSEIQIDARARPGMSVSSNANHGQQNISELCPYRAPIRCMILFET